MARTDETAGTDPGPVPGLTGRLAAGDEAAYREFFAQYYSRLTRYLFVLCRGDEHAAREALALMLTRVVRHVRPFPDENVFWSWLTVLARSAASDERRRQGRYGNFLQRFTRFSHVEEQAPPPTADNLDGLLSAALQRLPAEERQLLEAKYFQGLSVDRIASEAQLSPKAIESRLTRARQKLKSILTEELQHENES